MPDSGIDRLCGLVWIDPDDDAASTVSVPASADSILISLCHAHARTERRLERALKGEVVARNEEPTKSAERLASIIDRNLQEVADTPASTPEGVLAKARLAVRTGDDSVAFSVAQDVAGRGSVPPVPVVPVPTPLASEDELFDRYNAWLFNERRMLMISRFGLKDAEMAGRFVPCGRHQMHFPSSMSWEDVPSPMTRAAAVMVLAGGFVGPDNAMSPEQVDFQRNPMRHFPGSAA